MAAALAAINGAKRRHGRLKATARHSVTAANGGQLAPWRVGSGGC